MHLKTFSHQGVRNLEPGKLELSNGLNVFYGINGAGKSSILEAISFLTTGRSFRTAKLEHIIKDRGDELVVFGETATENRIGIAFYKNKKARLIKLDGKRINRLSELTSLYPTQVLSPESYHLIDSGPSERRKYLDWCLFHVKHNFHSSWKNYSHILKQRNALLKLGKSTVNVKQLDSWNEQLCIAADIINRERVSILSELEMILSSTLSLLDMAFYKSLSLKYYPGYTDSLQAKLESSFESDFSTGSTKFGPHKADLRIKIGNSLAKDHLSRGQKKVLINALFLSQTLLLKKVTKKDSLFIIDDFTSELDLHNQKALIDMLISQENVQIILSCLQQDSLKWLETGYNSPHMFHVEHGTIRSIIQ